MATARKLPSGNWRCLVYDYTDERGKRHYKSYTGKTKKDAEYKAASAKMRKELSSQTLGEALEEYIELRKATLSPATISGYVTIQKNQFREIEHIKVDDLTQKDVQSFISRVAVQVKPKTVRNIHGILSSVLREYRPDFALNTSLPKRIKPNINIPSESDIQRLMEAVKGTPMEIPILLAAFGPLRRGEICALDADHVKGDIVHVEYSLAINTDKEWIIKSPKTLSSNRKIKMPQFVIDKLPKQGRVTDLTPSAITAAFPRILKKIGIRHFRFHDLRHYSASIQHAMGVPDKYIMARGGWSTDTVLKTVYQHTMEEKEKEFNDKINSYFEYMQHEMQHKK